MTKNQINFKLYTMFNINKVIWQSFIKFGYNTMLSSYSAWNHF